MTVYSSDDDDRLLAIRKTIIVAIASDDVLMDRLVLKGGNALDIVYKLGERSSLDIDFSMARGFEGVDEERLMSERLFRALHERFDQLTPPYVVFDERFEQRPRLNPKQKPEAGLTLWGGYNATFKLIERSRFEALGGMVGEPPAGKVLESIRRESQVTGPGSERRFFIEISKFEYTEGRVLQTVDDYDCYVYTPSMIAAEKLRAICQQLPVYTQRKHPAPRPRDFFDVHTIATKAGCDIAGAEHAPLIREMFNVKQVPLELLRLIDAPEVRAFHAQEWPAVQNAVRGTTQGFDFYFDFVVGEVRRVCETLGVPARDDAEQQVAPGTGGGASDLGDG